MQSKLEIACAALFEEVIFYLFNICHQQNMLISFFFWREGILLLCKYSHIYIGFGEKMDKMCSAEIEGFLCPRYQSSTAIKHHPLFQSSRRLDSVQGTPGGHHLEPPDLKLPTCGALERRSDLNFPLYNFQWTPSIFFLFPETA